MISFILEEVRLKDSQVVKEKKIYSNVVFDKDVYIVRSSCILLQNILMKRDRKICMLCRYVLREDIDIEQTKI